MANRLLVPALIMLAVLPVAAQSKADAEAMVKKAIAAAKADGKD